MAEVATKFKALLEKEIERQLRYLDRNCPVRTGYLQSTLKQRGKIRVREAEPEYGRSGQQDTSGVVRLGGNTDYMQYVEHYRFIITEAAERLQNRLNRKKFTAHYEIDEEDYGRGSRRGRRGRGRGEGRRRPSYASSAATFASRRVAFGVPALISRLGGGGSYRGRRRRRRRDYSDESDQTRIVLVVFNVSEMVNIYHDDETTVVIEYAAEIVPYYT